MNKLITNKRTSTGLPHPDFHKFLKNPVEFSKITTQESDELYLTLKEALETYSGLGISANQLGINKRACLINVDDVELFLVNPVITFQSTNGFVFYESCLSLPKTMVKPILTLRASKIKITTDNLGELTFEVNEKADKGSKERVSMETLQTVVVQHEIDHLNGIIISNRMYNKPFVKKIDYNRNDKVMMKAPTGDIVEVKYKKSNDFYLKGYEVI